MDLRVSERLSEKKQERCIKMLDWCTNTYDKLNRKQQYAEYYCQADRALEYLTYLDKVSETFLMTEQAMQSDRLSDDASWIKQLRCSMQFGGFTDKEREYYAKALGKLGLDSPTRERLVKLNLADNLLFVTSLLTEMHASRDAIASKMIIDVLLLGERAYDDMSRKLKALGVCMETARYRQATERYRQAVSGATSVYGEALDELNSLKDMLVGLAYSGVAEVNDEVAKTDSIADLIAKTEARSARAELMTKIKSTFSGLPLAHLQLTEHCDIRRKLALMHRLDRDVTFGRIWCTYCEGMARVPKFMIVLADAETEFYDSLDAVQQKPVP